MRSATRLLVQPACDFFFEMCLGEAIQMARVPDFNHVPVLSNPFTRIDVKLLDRIAVSDDDYNRDFNFPQFSFSHSQFTETAGTGRRSSAYFSTLNLPPKLLQGATLTQPSHASDHAGERAILMS